MALERNNKEVFIQDTKQIIKVRELLTKFYDEIYLPTLKKFDGKVYNKRFLNALNEEAEKFFDGYNVYIKGDFDNYLKCLRFEIDVRKVYTLIQSMEFLACIDLESWRLAYDKTLENEQVNYWKENFVEYTKNYYDVIENYDEYLALAEITQTTIQKFNHLPSVFRQNIDKFQLNACC